MAIRIELHRSVVTEALNQRIALLKRGVEREVNPAIKELKFKDIAELQNAINTITDIK